MTFRTRSWSIIALAIFFAGCDTREDIAGPLDLPAGVPQASTSAEIGGASIRLTAEAYRNLMPGSTDSRLTVVLHLATADRSTFPTGLTATEAWVFLGSEVWNAVPKQEFAPSTPGRLDLILRGGPAWPVGSEVGVVVRLRSSTGTEQVLRANPAPIVTGVY